ncbi:MULTISPECIES: bifunctional phosphoribosylaminoimidazolecarboxamide formyltransferase/IMP cyclohydrolase [Fusobacterium]|uniref:bifunctional phosphoribosylaminoimidazolecarboxamide formyltransferase/IMP cyclohydrolase n=1 Tax=Fusobacterium TaxID=848 RepID=UPI0015A528F7|nr:MULTISPECIES: bifunctional phosphoribosylaminoimidazolecarboxamide formyltransferase/IMP cyclohydrolase [Fusobacterium]MCF2612962.1 bifunctional phosphoribosylaminoimidazolecarboxamide formyltransferase/IMP cyclohydrolase [Fusobacterium perfoetens]MDY2980098.1 bifunctional phosphoribosylaminoimidazolecarboxamide formyltransferase/IMP cyclohydrolase [Fusobacterium sp.]
MKRALISVSDKTGIVEFAKELSSLGYEIISTGGTKKSLDEAGIKTIGISDVTKFPEMMDGRVKTLHPNVHGGLLCVRDNPQHMKDLVDNHIELIDMVVVNLYPFKETLKKGGTHEELIENIDIGGPSMLRSAAKNHKFVTVCVDPADYQRVLDEVRANGDTTLEFRCELAAKVFRTTAAYDALIANYLTSKLGIEYPEKLTLTYEKVQDLRYGENPHQTAAFYATPMTGYSLASAKQLHGKELSYNNIQDANGAIEILREFLNSGKKAVVAVKHTNPCGVGIGDTLKEAWDRAYSADPISIFGGIVATNEVIDIEVAKELHKLFLEIVIAPGFTDEALEILMAKKNIRLMTLDIDQEIYNKKKVVGVNDGILLQDVDFGEVKPEDLVCVTETKPTEEDIQELLFGWKVVKNVKSNAIVVSKNNQTLGVGAGQMNRVGAAKIALEQAGEKSRGAYLSSDAFFPMPDTVQLAIEYGIKAIIQPGGSIKDQLSIDECNKHGIAMVFTKMRHFKH